MKITSYFIIISIIAFTSSVHFAYPQISDMEQRTRVLGQDSLNVHLIGRWANGPCFGVAAVGNTAYFGNGGYFEIVDFANPAQPVERGKLLLPSAIMGIDVSGNYAYVANYFAGFRVIDISNPAAPKEVGMLPTRERSLNVFVNGNYAYLSDGYAGLRIIDVSDPSNPTEIGSFVGNYPTHDVVVAGTFAYLANDAEGLLVIDISNPNQPTLAGSFKTGNRASGIAVQGTYVYVADRADGLRIIDVANPYNPAEIGFFDTDGMARGVKVQATFAYLADDSLGLKIIDVSNPYNPTQAGTLDTDGSAYQVSPSGNYVYVADFHNGLRMIDASNFYQPGEIGYFETDGNSRGVAVNGNYAFIANGEAGLRILDISKPTAPFKIGQYNISGFCEDIAVQDNYAYLTNGNGGLWIFDVADPSNPVEISNYKQNLYAHNVIVEGDYAYIADWSDGLKISDISNPSQPALTGYFTLPGKRAHGIAKKENFIYLAAGNDGLRVIDVSTPSQPVELGFLNINGFATGIAVKGFYVYLGVLQNELKIIDISDPVQPKQVSSFVLSHSPYGVYVRGRYVFVANGRFGLHVINVSNPGQPIEAGYYNTGCWAYGNVTVANNLIFLPDEMDGLYIMEFDGISQNMPPDAPSLISIPDRYSVNQTPSLFSWDIPSDINGDPLDFRLEISQDSNWQSIDYHFESMNSTADFSPMPPVSPASGSMSYTLQTQLSEGTWFWRVSAWDGLEFSEYSEVWRFNIDLTTPIINRVTYENPGYGENWFNPNTDSIARVMVNYDELNPRFGYLFCQFLTDTLINPNLTGGLAQQTRFVIPIAGQHNIQNYVIAQVKDLAGNIGVMESELRLDAFPPFGYYSNAPDTVEMAQVYDVQVLNARDEQSGLANIYLDVYSAPDSIPKTPRNRITGVSTPGIYYYRYFAEDYLGNRGEIKTDTTIVVLRAPIFITTDTIEVNAGDEFWIDIQVGTEDEPVSEFFGAAFEFNYSNTQYVDVVSIDSIVPGDFLGSDVVFFPYLDDENGTVSIGITRKREQGGVSGAGTITRIKFSTDPDTQDRTPIHFTFPSVSANDTAGILIELIPKDTTIWIVQSISDFTMTVEPGERVIQPGDTADFSVSFEKIGDFDSQLSLSVFDLPQDMEANLPVNPVNIPSSLLIQFATTDSIQPGLYHPIIVATGGGVEHRDTIAIEVIPLLQPDFSMAVTPDSQSIAPGDSTVFQLSFQAIDGFSAQLSLEISNLAPGMSAIFPAGTFSIPALFNVIFTTTTQIVPGTYLLIITATGGGKVHRDTVVVRISPGVSPDFSMMVTPKDQSIYPGDSARFHFSFQPIQNFNSQLSLNISNLAPGLTALFPSGSFSIPADFDITFVTSTNIDTGLYQPIITATGGGISHQDSVVIQVVAEPPVIQVTGVLPNPFTPNDDGFNDYVEFKFPEILSGGDATIQIFDINGRKIREIRNSIRWSGRDDSGREMKPGAYIYVVKNGGKVISRGVISLAR